MSKQFQSGSTQILILVLIIIIVVLSAALFFYNKREATPVTTVSTNSANDKLVPPQAPQFKTYTNSKYGYSISYPETLIIREFPDTGTGAGFRPVGTADDPANEVITVDVLEKNADMAKDNLEDYAKVAATIQIQNYQKLNSINPVQANSGITGYKTTWMVMPLTPSDSTVSAQLVVSDPITYFDLPKAKSPSTVQVTLGDKNYDSDYNAMIKTFSLTN